jgi:hypothetical protein
MGRSRSKDCGTAEDTEEVELSTPPSFGARWPGPRPVAGNTSVNHGLVENQHGLVRQKGKSPRKGRTMAGRGPEAQATCLLAVGTGSSSRGTARVGQLGALATLGGCRPTGHQARGLSSPLTTLNGLLRREDLDGPVHLQLDQDTKMGLEVREKNHM